MGVGKADDIDSEGERLELATASSGSPASGGLKNDGPGEGGRGEDLGTELEIRLKGK